MKERERSNRSLVYTLVSSPSKIQEMIEGMVWVGLVAHQSFYTLPILTPKKNPYWKLAEPTYTRLKHARENTDDGYGQTQQLTLLYHH